MRKRRYLIIRLLCSLIDFLIILIPVQLVMMGIFNVSPSQADLFFKFLYAVYATLTTEYLGATLGKFCGRLSVVNADGSGKVPVFYLGIRELVKSLYITPIAGQILLVISLLMMIIRKDNRSLHDFAGNTKVIYAFEKEEEEEEKDETHRHS